MNLQIVKSIAGSTVFKLASSVISFITVPILLKSLGTNDYAVWVTLTALVAWVSLFDFGSGFSLKNKIAEATATGKEINSLVAGTLQFYTLASVVMLCAFLVSLLFVKVFKDHTLIAFCIYVPVIISFPGTLGNFMLQGKKLFNLLYSLQFSQSVLWLGVILLYRFNVVQVSLTKMALSYASIFLIINLVLLFIAAKQVNFEWRSYFDWSHFRSSKKTLSVGLRFFILQISSLILFSIGNLLIYKNLSLENVSQYDTINKVFMMGITVFNIVISVYWSEISQAKALKNKALLFKYYMQLILLSTLFCLGFFVVSLFLPSLIFFWTKGIIIITRQQVYPFMLLISIQVFSFAGNVFLNAFEELNGQIFFSIVAASLLIPVANLLFHLKMGISTIPVSSSILSVPSLIYVLYKGYTCIKKVESHA